MDSEGMEENGMRTRSFRYEDYSNRRVFLRSYPLHLGGDQEDEEEEAVKVVITKESPAEIEKKPVKTKKKPVKQIIISMFHWGGSKVVVLRRFKHKFSVYIIACVSAGFKSPAILISARS